MMWIGSILCMTVDPAQPPTDETLIQAVKAGDLSAFEQLVAKYQPRIFGTARRYARREDEVEDIVQEIFIKAFQKLDTFRGESPFEHWLMRLAVRVCYDFLRKHQRNKETAFTDISEGEVDWLAGFSENPQEAQIDAEAAKKLVDRIFEKLSPASRMVLTLLEIENRSVKEIADLTGWSISLVKVRAFRARGEMKKILEKLNREQF